MSHAGALASARLDAAIQLLQNTMVRMFMKRPDRRYAVWIILLLVAIILQELPEPYYRSLGVHKRDDSIRINNGGI